jgi:hypothetical protein
MVNHNYSSMADSNQKETKEHVARLPSFLNLVCGGWMDSFTMKEYYCINSSIGEEEVIRYFFEAHHFVHPFVINSIKKEELVPTLVQLDWAGSTRIVTNFDTVAIGISHEFVDSCLCILIMVT